MPAYDEVQKRLAEAAQSRSEYLDLSDLTLTSLPDALWGMTQIEMLHAGDNSLIGLSPGIGQLRNLQVLNLGNNVLHSLPPEIGRLNQMHSLTLGVSPNFDGFPEEIGQLTSLLHLELTGATVDTWIAELGQIAGLRAITLKACDLRDISGLSACDNLASLALIDCTMHDVASQLVQLTTLDELVIETKQAPMTDVPNILGSMIWLKNLVINSPALETIPASIGQMKKLRVLHIHAGDKLKALPEEIGELDSLLELSVHHAGLTELPDSIGRLTRLKQMKVQSCGLTRLPGAIGSLSALQDLRLSRNRLETLPTTLAKCQGLRYLSIDNNELTELPSDLAHLPQLAYITMEDNPRLEAIPEGVRVSNYVEIGGTDIRSLPASLMGARVDIYGEPVDPASYFTQADEISDEDAWEYDRGALRVYTESLTDGLKDALPRLRNKVVELSFEEIDIDFPSIDVTQFPNLEKLVFGVIHYSTNRPIALGPEVEALTNLHDLEVLSSWLILPSEIGHWNKLENIFAETARIDLPETLIGGDLPNLRVFSMGLGSMIERLPGWLGLCPSLETVRLHECSLLEELPATFANHHMEELSVFQCEDLTGLPNGMTLSRLLIRKANKISALPEDLVITGYLDASGLDAVTIPENFKQLIVEEQGYRDLQSIYIDPRYLTPIAVLTEPTQEIQRAQVAAVGLERFLDVLNVEVIDEDIFQGKLRRVLRVQLEGEQPVIAVEVRDELGSTFRLLAPDMQPPQTGTELN